MLLKDSEQSTQKSCYGENWESIEHTNESIIYVSRKRFPHVQFSWKARWIMKSAQLFIEESYKIFVKILSYHHLKS